MNTESLIIITAGFACTGGLVARSLWRREIVVDEGFTALLFRRGKFDRLLESGRHVVWGRFLRFERVDLRRQAMALSGQEVLTKDGVGLKLSAILNWQVVDPLKMQEAQQPTLELYNLAHQSVRRTTAEMTVEELLSARMNIGRQLLEATVEAAAGLGVRVISTEVRDVMLPGDLRKAFNDVLKARQEGVAALERARGETAALRNLANAARMMADNPALMNLRVLQTVNDAKGAGNNTLVMGMPGGFVPMTK